MDRRRLKVKSAAGNVKVSHRWTISITVGAFFLTMGINALTSNADDLGLIMAMITLLLIILFGVVFDLVGVAVSTASETPFHAMAAKKIPGARESIAIIRHAQQISSFCNDVIGDIAGVISGAMTGAIVIGIVRTFNVGSALLGLLVTALVASMMIGGKAAGKGVAMVHNNTIVFVTGKVAYFFKRLIPRWGKKQKNRKQV